MNLAVSLRALLGRREAPPSNMIVRCLSLEQFTLSDLSLDMFGERVSLEGGKENSRNAFWRREHYEPLRHSDGKAKTTHTR